MSQVRNRRSRRWLWIVGVLFVGAIVVFLGWRFIQDRASTTQAATTGEIVTAFIGDLASTASATGRVAPQREADLALGISGRVEEVHVQVGDQVSAGDVLVTLDRGALERNVTSAEQALIIQEANLAEMRKGAEESDIASARAAVNSAQAQVDDLLAGPTPEEIANAEAGVNAAEAQIWSASAQVGQVSSGASEAEIAAQQQQVAVAEQQFEQAKRAHEQTLQCFESPTGEEICPGLGAAEEAARANMDAAGANLASARAQLAALTSGPDQNALSGAQAGVSAAAFQRDAAQANLDLLLRGPSAAQIAAAESTLAQAQASLDNLLRGPSEEQLAIAEAQVAQARVTLEEAQENLQNATLLAPFDSVITAVNVAEGEMAGGVAVSLVDTGNLSVILDVDEIDIGGMSVGQEAVITLESWPDEDIESAITSIAPSATTNTGSALVTYEVRLSLGETDLPVRIGMTANANLITGKRADVLLVPNAAINADRSAGTFSVNLVRLDEDGNQTIEEVEVTIGLRDANNTQITSGLQEGDQVMIGNVTPVFQFGPPDENGNGGPPDGFFQPGG